MRLENFRENHGRFIRILALLKDELINYHPLGKLSYYQLSKKGALKVGLPSTRAQSVGERLTEHLQRKKAHVSAVYLPPGESGKVGVDDWLAEGGAIVGSSHTRVYHSYNCVHAKRIAPENLVVFESIAEAKAQGRRPCRFCRPP